MSEEPIPTRELQVAFVAGVLVGLGPVVTTMQEWRAMVSPAFVGIAMSIVGGVLGAIYVRQSVRDRVNQEVQRALGKKSSADSEGGTP